MALETLRVTVLSDDVTPVAVQDVVVRVYNAAGSTLITQDTTDDDGVVEFELNGGTVPIEYQLRFFYSGGTLPRAVRVDVTSPPGVGATNQFEVTAHLFTLPEATDPTLCRASGRVVGPDGRPRRGVDMHFIPVLGAPAMANERLVLGERVAVKTDADGYVEIDLFREACYTVTVEGHENTLREVEVPDAPAVNIGKLLFPIVERIEWSPTPPYTVAVEGMITIYPEVISSTGIALADLGSDVSWYVDDESIASIRVLGDRIEVHGQSVGTTTLRVKRVDESIKYTPDVDLSGAGASINVIA